MSHELPEEPLPFAVKVFYIGSFIICAGILLIWGA